MTDQEVNRALAEALGWRLTSEEATVDGRDLIWYQLTNSVTGESLMQSPRCREPGVNADALWNVSCEFTRRAEHVFGAVGVVGGEGLIAQMEDRGWWFIWLERKWYDEDNPEGFEAAFQIKGAPDVVKDRGDTPMQAIARAALAALQSEKA